MLKDRIAYLVRLGLNMSQDEGLDAVIARSYAFNPWFTPDFCRNAIRSISDQMLTEEKLNVWLSGYDMPEVLDRTVGIIMAGNLPLVGFHDFLCAYISGCKVKVKLSGKDDVLFPYVYGMLCSIDPVLVSRCAIVERMDGYDAMIATGSNNSNRYFEYYFRNHPKILRKNRNSIAVLDGSESDAELDALADDIFMYFGFGCRNVSKLYLPKGYNVTVLFPHFARYKWMHDHTKYMNNYDYNRTLLLMNRTPHLSDDVIMLQENSAISTPVSVVYYEFYDSLSDLKVEMSNKRDQIQCIAAGKSAEAQWGEGEVVPLGKTQAPELGDYADGVDTIAFLISLKSL